MSSHGTFPFCVITPDGRDYEEQILAILKRAGFIVRHTLELPATVERLVGLPGFFHRKAGIVRNPEHPYLAIALRTPTSQPYLALFEVRNAEIGTGRYFQQYVFWPLAREFKPALQEFVEPLRRSMEQAERDR
jgi:hypothetical protein